MFFFRKRKLVVDVLTHRQGVLDCSKPKKAIKFVPDWWKQCPMNYVSDNSFFQSATIKTCPAFVGLYTTGLIIPMWCDLAIEMSEIGTAGYRWQFADQESQLESHDFSQINNHLDPREYAHLKFTSPWSIKTKENVQWIWMQPEWSHLKNYDFRVVPGLRNFKTTHGTHINVFFRKRETAQNILIKHLDPLVHLVPLIDNDRKLDIRYHLVSEGEHKNLATYPTSFVRPTAFCINQREKA